MARQMDDSYNHASGKDLRYEDFVNKYKWKKGWQRLRLFGLVYTDARHNNIKTQSNKAYNEFCLGYDVDNDRFFQDREQRCDCCKLGMQTQLRYFVNVFSVDEWERRPAVLPSDWNPIYLADLPPSLMNQIVGLKQINGGHMVGDPVKGAIISVNYNPEAPSPAQTYSVSMDTKNWAFEPDMIKFGPFPQDTPEGKRDVRRGTDVLPPAWVYYPCRNTKERMRKSLVVHGYFGKEGGTEATSEVETKGRALLSELSGLVKEADKPKSGVKELVKLREESNGIDHAAPPPRAVKPAEAPASPATETDEIPF